MSLLEFDRMGIERSERVREMVMGEQERKAERGKSEKENKRVKGVGGHKGPQRCPGTPGTCCLSLTLTHFPAQMKGFVLLCSAALISHQHICSSTQFTPIAEIFVFAFGAEEERYLAIWKFGRDCNELVQINCERPALGELCVVAGRSTVARGFV